MAKEWMTPDNVADELGIARRTALSLMHQMPHSVIGGTTRKRIRVARSDLDAWMAERGTGRPGTRGRQGEFSSDKRVPRRGE